MPFYRNLVFRIWPKTLLWQITLPLAASLICAGLGIWFTIETLAQQQRDQVVDSLRHISESFQALPPGAAGKADLELERFLIVATVFPIQRIAILDKRGYAALASERPANGAVYLRTDSPRMELPPERTPDLQVMPEKVIRWQPIGNTGGTAAWLMIGATLQHINQWRLKTLGTVFAWYGMACGAALLMVIVRVRKSSRAISDSARFAETIPSQPDLELPPHGISDELDRLAGALNRFAKHWHHRLRLSEQANSHLNMHKLAVDAHAAVCITDPSGRIEYANPHFCSASGYEPRELLGRNIGLLNSGYHDDNYFKNLWRTLALGRIWQGALCNRNKRGGTYWVQCTIAPVRDHLGGVSQYIAIQTLASPKLQSSDAVAGK